MDRKTALRHLPELYARALMLKEEGLSEAQIAARLEIPEEAVGPCLTVAEAKLLRIVTDGPEDRRKDKEKPR